MIKPAGRITGIKASQTILLDSLAKDLAQQGQDVINLTAGELDFETSNEVLDAAKDAIDANNNHYSKPQGLPQVRSAVCNFLSNNYDLDFNDNQIIITNGAKQALYSCLQVLINSEDEVLVPVPGWVSYSQQIKLADGVVIAVETTDDFQLDIDAFNTAVTEKTVGIILNYPNNPTGAVYDLEQLEKIADFAREHNLWVISDEIYSKLLYDDSKFISFAKIYPERTIVINGVSKSGSMTGWRVGFAAGPENVIDAMTVLQSHLTGNVCNIAQFASLPALNMKPDSLDNILLELARRRKVVIEWVDANNKISLTDPAGAFYCFLDISEITEDSEIFCETLLTEFGVALVPGKYFGRDSFVRLSFASSLENVQEALKRMTEFIEKY
ncbi:MAG: pyridoxal phosphate-dependent aminotransferase [bacterium]|nr:pyridoxal phosphate-dependent aminotransferase [bacterium]